MFYIQVFFNSTFFSGNESASKQSPFPFTKEATVDFIAAAGNKLWKELVGTDVAMKVTNISLSFTGIEEGELGQKSIEGFLKRKREENISSHGLDEVCLDTTPACAAADEEISHCDSRVLSFICPRCHNKIQCAVHDAHSLSAEELDIRAAALRMEHDDYHFAQDLASNPEESTQIRKSDMRRPHKRQERSGIEKYFKKT